MGSMYEIKCLDCGCKKEVLEGYGFVACNSLYYCPNCNEITVYSEKIDYTNPQPKKGKVAHNCKTCGAELEKFEIIRKDEKLTMQIDLTNMIKTALKQQPIEIDDDPKPSIQLKCKNCKSENIKITETGLWD